MTRSGSVSLNSSKGVECSVVMFVPRAEIAANRKCAKTGQDRVSWTGGCVDGRLYWKVCLVSILGAKKG